MGDGGGTARRMARDIEIGDLVRIKAYDWIAQRIALVTDRRHLTHDQTEQEYVAITARVGGKEYTFSEADFELVSKAERKEK